MRSRAATVTDALLAPPAGEVSGAELMALRDELGRDLAALASDLPAHESLRVDAFKVLAARRHPERCTEVDDPFAPSPGRCRRAVGAAAVARCVRGFSPGPAAAVAEVLAAGLDDVTSGPATAGSAPWWAPWYGGLAPGARAVVGAEAVTWATALLTALEWRRLPRQAVVGGRADWWQCPGSSALVLQGRADVRLHAARRPAYLVLGSGRCRDDWRVELGFPALVAALGRAAPSVPCRVVGVWPQSGQVRVLPVDITTLRATGAAVASAVGTWVDGRLEAQPVLAGR
ncbi:MAG TPA: hypothetical protein VLZ77_00910 [Acidimicrobiales bacterium]|nr:hypothetical protein [Acidimicrobiales bacterium]